MIDPKQINTKVLNIVQIADKLSKSKWNVVVFKDDPWLYTQFYVGLFLEKPTILIIRESDKRFIKRLKHKLVKHIIKIKEFDEADSKEIADKIAKIAKEEK